MKQVVIVGVGALGSHVAQFLRNAPAELTLVDFDRVESKNTLSQFHARQGQGKNKAQALKDVLAFLWNAKVKTVPHKLTADNVRQLLVECDLVIDCVDNAEARQVLRTYCRGVVDDGGSIIEIPGLSVRTFTTERPVITALGRPALLHGALAPGGTFGQAVWDAHFAIDAAVGEGVATCEDGEFLPFITMVASYLAHAAQAFLATGQTPSFMIHPTGAVRVA